MLILYDFDLSANCYAVRLLAALLDIAIALRRIDVHPGRENAQEPFLLLNPLGTVPVLETGVSRYNDWPAILIYLASTRDATGNWWHDHNGDLIEWLGFARLLEHSAGLARLHDGMGYPADIDRARRQAHDLLRVLERHLWFGEHAGNDWLLPGEAPTVADIAIFVHVILCEEGGIARMNYPTVRRWTDRIRALDRFVAMSGVFLPPSLPPAITP